MAKERRSSGNLLRLRKYEFELKESHVPHISRQLTAVLSRHAGLDGADDQCDRLEIMRKTLSEITSKNLDFYNKKVGLYEKVNNSKNILEIGAGLGRVSVFLNERCKMGRKNRNFYLVDGHGKYNGYNWNHHTFYNDLSETKSFCELNGLKNFDMINVTASNNQVIKFAKFAKESPIIFDFIISIFCLSYHQSISSYKHILREVCDRDAKVILTVRNTKIAAEKLEFDKLFESYSIINLDEKRFPVSRKKYNMSLCVAEGIKK